jgi:hypothetical protein
LKQNSTIRASFESEIYWEFIQQKDNRVLIAFLYPVI